MENKISTKIKEAKERKKNNLLEAGYQLFSTKGVTNTSVQDIVNKANIAKGTFYLYFKDKYALEEAIVIHKSKQLFDEALTALKKQNIKENIPAEEAEALKKQLEEAGAEIELA